VYFVVRNNNLNDFQHALELKRFQEYKQLNNFTFVYPTI
jgi:hypothetical protein